MIDANYHDMLSRLGTDTSRDGLGWDLSRSDRVKHLSQCGVQGDMFARQMIRR